MITVQIEPIIVARELIGTKKRIKLFGLTIFSKTLRMPLERELDAEEFYYQVI